MDSIPIKEQTAYMPEVDPSSLLVTSSPRVYQSPLANDFVFSPPFSLLPDLLFYDIP